MIACRGNSKERERDADTGIRMLNQGREQGLPGPAEQSESPTVQSCTGCGKQALNEDDPLLQISCQRHLPSPHLLKDLPKLLP
jgi:hypothetical protein